MQRKPRILIIDDEPLMRISISDALKGEGYAVAEAAAGNAGLNMLRENGADVIISDLRLPDIDGLEVLKGCKRISPESAVILVTAHGSVNTAVEAMRHGAYDYITKPFDMEELLLMVRRIIRYMFLEEENRILKAQVEGKYDFDGIVSGSEKMNEVFEMVKSVAQTDSTVLLLGESGTGKELIANALHHTSPRKTGPFVKVSCAALPETLLEAELFGYEKGAFTGAVRQKKGRFELAHKGTLFLDEIGEISQGIQVKLLRVLQEKQFERLGGIETLSVDVRIICATQRDLKKEVQKGAFREDLFYRLNVVPITLPPLRERKKDIMLLTDHFVGYFAGLYKKPMKAVAKEALLLLLNYPFPGNVRELENAIERAVVLGKGEELLPYDLPEEISAITHGHVPAVNANESLSKVVKDFERQYIMKVLDETSGNKGLAARMLGVSRKTLWEKCKALDIDKECRRLEEEA